MAGYGFGATQQLMPSSAPKMAPQGLPPAGMAAPTQLQPQIQPQQTAPQANNVRQQIAMQLVGNSQRPQMQARMRRPRMMGIAPPSRAMGY